MHVIVAGIDAEEICNAIEAQGHDVSVVDVANRPSLESAGIHDAAALVLTEAAQATAIAVAKDLNPDLKTVVYTGDSLPDFARGQVDLVVDPDLLDAETVAEELDS